MMANEQLLSPSIMHTMRALETLLNQERVLEEPIVVDGLELKDMGLEERRLSGGPAGPWPTHRYHVFAVTHDAQTYQVFVGPFVDEERSFINVGMTEDKGASLELNLRRYVNEVDGTLRLWHSGAMTVVGHGPLKHQKVRAYVAVWFPELVRRDRIELGTLPVKSPLAFADVQPFLVRLFKYAIARRTLKERIRVLASLDLKRLAQLLRRPLDSPETLALEGWETSVKPFTRPFLEAVRIRLPKELLGDGPRWELSQFSEAKRKWQCWDRASINVGPASLQVSIGLDDRSGETSSCLFSGLALWGSRTEMETQREHLIAQGVLRSGDDVRLVDGDAFSGTSLLAGQFLGPEQVEQMDADTLVGAIVGELQKWAARMEGFTDSPVSQLQNYLEARGFHFPCDVIATYYLSLQTKPFVILSGISGTGKTKLAQIFAEFISPPTRYEVEEPVVEEPGDDTFTLTVRPYMQKYGRVVIPVDAWSFFSDLDLGEKTRVTVQVGDEVEDCQLSRQEHPANPNGYLQLLFKGSVRLWVRDEAKVGDVIEVQRTGSEDASIYRLERQKRRRRRVTVRQDFTAFVPVRPDWTDHRGLLGFHHLLTGAYHGTDFLRLLLRARIDWEAGRRRPHFVVLDEMNLARVEHYFADFLSVLESRRWTRGPSTVVTEETVTPWQGKKVASITIRKDIRERYGLQDGRSYRLRIKADAGAVVEDEFRLTSGGEVYLSTAIAERFAGAQELRSVVVFQERPLVEQDVFPLHDQPRCLLTAGNETLAEGFYAEGDQKTCLVRCRGCPLAPFVKEAYHHRGEYDYAPARDGGFDPLCFTPPRLRVPLNVYFSGTVNVDETTFTFSPKVLDRANVIEFQAVDLSGYFASRSLPENAPPADEATVRAFTHNFMYPFASVGRNPEAHNDPALAPYRVQLEALVALLQPFHQHFGYRVADEILAYLINAQRLNDPHFSLDDAFDRALLQKVLPKFHGSRARLWAPLLRLLAFCTKWSEPSPGGSDALAARVAKLVEEWVQDDANGLTSKVADRLRLPQSGRKLLRMLRDLDAEGFTSFT